MGSRLPVDGLGIGTGNGPLIALAAGLLVALVIILAADQLWHKARRLRRSAAKLAAENAALRAQLAQQEAYGEADSQALAESRGHLAELERRAQAWQVTAEEKAAQAARHTAAQRELEERLRQAHRLEAVTRLAGGLAHELSNLLGLVIAHADVALADPSLPARARQDFESMRAAAAQAASLSGQFLAFGPGHARPTQSLDLNAFIANLQHVLYHVLGSRIRLEARLGDDLARVQADAGQVAQVLTTLSLYAAEGMRNGGRLLYLTANAKLDRPHACAYGELPAGEYVSVAVHYDGQVADWQRTAQSLMPAQSRGAGSTQSWKPLDLSLCREIVDQAGGHIHAELEPASGATFTIYWPTIPRAQDLIASDVRQERRGLGMVLLVAEDGALRILVDEILTLEGYQVAQAAGAEEALALAEEMRGSIDLLVTELDLSDLTEQLAAWCPGLRVIYVAAASVGPRQDLGAVPEVGIVLDRSQLADDLADEVRALLEPEQTGELPL